jgi:hypothetical protein
MPVTTPVVAFTVATVGQAILHVPPVEGFVSVIVDPAHTEVGPTIGVAAETTVIVFVAAQPATVYLMVTVPGLTPPTMPVTAPTVAIVTSVLLQIPPVEELASGVVAPTHTVPAPVIAEGKGLTDMVLVVKQPPPIV